MPNAMMNQRRELQPMARDSVARIEEHVHLRLTGRVRDLRLVVVDGSLVLRGRAQTYYAKQLAQHAVMEMSDLPIRDNQIEVP